VEFHEPVHVGDILSLWAQVTRIGRTSLRVHVEVRALRRDSDCETRVTQADVTLVAIDGAGRPTPVQDAASEGVPDNRLP